MSDTRIPVTGMRFCGQEVLLVGDQADARKFVEYVRNTEKFPPRCIHTRGVSREELLALVGEPGEVPKPEPTICFECEYCVSLADINSHKAVIACKKPPFTPSLNYVTGDSLSAKPLGCDVRNPDGKCKYYKSKKS